MLEWMQDCGGGLSESATKLSGPKTILLHTIILSPSQPLRPGGHLELLTAALQMASPSSGGTVTHRSSRSSAVSTIGPGQPDSHHPHRQLRRKAN